MPGYLIKRTWPHDPTVYGPPKYRRACSYEAFVPDMLRDLPVRLEAQAAGVVSDAESSIQGLNAVAYPALVPLARLLLRTESIASSKVEGLQVGVRELARAESREETGGKAGPTATEILGNIAAMEIAVEHAATVGRFTIAEVVAIHRRLMERSPNPQIAGHIRTSQNWIGGNDFNPCGADFVPPPPERIQTLLADLCEAINDDRLPPVVQAALVHAQCETIHPFDDGTGRTGRALIHVVLRRRGIAPSYVPPVSVVLAAARDRYVAGLNRFRGVEVAAWIEQFAAAAARAAQLAKAYLVAVQELMAWWRAQLRAGKAPRADAAAWAIIDILPAHPMITAPVAAAATRRAKAAVYQALEDLSAAGVLLPLSQSRRNRSWEAVGLLDLLAGLEAGRFPDSTIGGDAPFGENRAATV